MINFGRVFFTTVYASPNATIRRNVWDFLSALQPAGDEVWLLGWDFNSIVRTEERDGGAIPGNGLVLYFKSSSLLMNHPQFEEFLRSNWDMERDVESNIWAFTEEVQHWNVSVFGHIRWKKKDLLAWIRGIDRALRVSHSEFMIQLDVDLRAELDEILREEENFWLQKSGVQWIKFGDRNTSYFHRCVMEQRQENFVHELRDESGAWCSDQARLHNMVVHYYKEFFLSNGIIDPGYVHRGYFSQCTEDMRRVFNAPVMDDEMTSGGDLVGRNEHTAVPVNLIEDWMLGFYRKVGVCSVLGAELWGVTEGLRLAWDAGIRVVLLEVDNSDVAQKVQDKAQVSGLHGLVPTIHELVGRDWVVRVRQIRWSANMVADGMAKWARSSYGSSLLDVGFATRVFSMPLDEIGV
ncbi:hypothetical protein V6N12_016142 [Hibiscus sabdariffa]|uniref:RNase H type-1 domain-containing protein n=1 Tax=Hibiscus sabdariffa TaxID=183260 RepID=A0ABR2C997_9ROSI